MTISALDLKFRQSERMTDFSDGGGSMGATEIVSGVMNNVFSDMSDADGIRGAVSLRKIFAQVNSANTDAYLGPFFFLTDVPVNENVDVLAFQTKSATDERTDARNYYENYRVRGVKSPFVLYGNHFAGQSMIQVYCRTETPSPEIGDVFCLSVEATGYTPLVQFVKVQKVASRSTVTFTDSNGDFVRDVLIIQTTTALGTDLPGLDDPNRLSSINAPTLVRYTQVADSAKYYGFKALSAITVAGAYTVHVDSPYIAAVPVTQSQVTLTDQLAGLGTVSMIVSGATDALSWSGSLSGAAGASVTRYLGSPFARRSVNITVGAVSLRDNGAGGIVAVNPSDTGWGGGVDYTTGAVTLSRDVGFSGTVSITATPAGGVLSQGYTRAIPITPATRGVAYVIQIPGAPARGTVTLDFLALGKWIRLSDNGNGQLAGNAGEGSGTINYATGAIAVTLGALPDNDSALLLGWGTDLRARDSHGEITVPTPLNRQQLAHGGIVPGTLDITWTSGGVGKTASAAASGAITGDATGVVDVASGVVVFSTSAAIDSGTQYSYAYDYVDASKLHSETFTPTAAGHAVSVTLAHAPAAANSVIARWAISVPPGSLVIGRRQYAIALQDDGSGGWAGDNKFTGTNTIDYSTGAITLTVEGS